MQALRESLNTRAARDLAHKELLSPRQVGPILYSLATIFLIYEMDVTPLKGKLVNPGEI